MLFRSEAIRFTRSKDNATIYCFALKWPGKALTLRSVQPRVGSQITMFGYPDALRWSFDATTGLSIEIPESLASESHRPSDYAWGWTIRVA